MTAGQRRGPVVIDTDVYGAELVPGAPLAAMYQPIILGRPAFISFQTAAELRYGALRRNWGASRMRKLEARIAKAETVHSGPELVLVYARLRADRWIVATAIRLAIPLVSNDGIFRGVPGLMLEAASRP